MLTSLKMQYLFFSQIPVLYKMFKNIFIRVTLNLDKENYANISILMTLFIINKEKLMVVMFRI